MSSKCPVRELNWLELRQPSMANLGLPVGGGRGVEQSAAIFALTRMQQAREQRVQEWQRRWKLLGDMQEVRVAQAGFSEGHNFSLMRAEMEPVHTGDARERVLTMGTQGRMLIAVIEPNTNP